MATNVGPQMKALLDRYGLGALAPWLSQQIINGASLEEIEADLYDHPTFTARFPSIKARETAGLPPLAVDEYLAYESTMSQVSRAFGITMTKAQTDALLAKDISAQEAQERLGMASKALFASPPETRDRLEALYGWSSGEIISLLVDPQNTLPQLQRKMTAAEIAASAQRAGFNTDLTAGQAEGLFEAGVSGESALEGFGQLVQAEELFEGTDETEEDIGVDQQLKLVTGDQDVTKQVERRGERRAARFAEGGGFSTGQTGVRGLGSANV